ncbi:nicotinate phosphoribosyltransferase [Desulfofundulus thermocisternus]|uniref:nicotinate phosphoribosyltransferase n=1 Tax=Desulfofundulus thermocisternus TaxID=42471 RepID=UPI0019E156E1|nr:nicotinate phosphoribosyltransferase [Desulfofundulus thermocisternus]MBE3586415.1 nicotinate phosphoribosyltransferase [Thermoanaerobacter sp.]MCS5696722.1 nicotinate phosphoribosyltransferase [Desulfofundulus thermocisternus]
MESPRTIQNLKEVADFRVTPGERLFSASNQEIMAGWTTDIYFIKTREILRAMGLDGTEVTAEIFAGREGVLAGVPEVKTLLAGKGVEVWSLPEGEWFGEKEVVMRIHGPYDRFGIYETAILGILASSSGWATAARKCREAAGNKRVVCFGARHVHPAVAPVMERAAIVGGADGASCILGAKLAGQEPVGTLPHAVMLIVGDTVEVALAYQRTMPQGTPVIVLVDTFKDEAEEALRVARVLGKDLAAIRLDTPGERGGVTPALVREVRARLDQAGYNHVEILVSGGLTPERIQLLSQAGADSFGVGSYISGAAPIDMTMDLKEVNGKPVAKRGRIPGITPSPRLQRIL